MMARSNQQPHAPQAPHLIVRQQPLRAQVVQENNPKNRKPIDPPPIIELKYDDPRDPNNSQWLVSPRTFMMVTMVVCKDGSNGNEEVLNGKYLIGQTVSSLHRLKDINNKGELPGMRSMMRLPTLTNPADGGFFVFGDISARKVGQYKLRFSLFDTAKLVSSQLQDTKLLANCNVTETATRSSSWALWILTPFQVREVEASCRM